MLITKCNGYNNETISITREEEDQLAIPFLENESLD